MMSNRCVPGALFVLSGDVDVHQLSQAQSREHMARSCPKGCAVNPTIIQIPLIYAEPTMGRQLRQTGERHGGNWVRRIGRVRHHGEEQGDRGIRK